MLSKALRRIAIAMLLVVSATLVASVTQAQTLDQTLSGCNGAAPLRTVQADRSNYQTKVNDAIPGDRILLAADTYGQFLTLNNKHGEPGKCIVIEGPASGSALFTGSETRNIVSLTNASYIALRNLTLDGQGKWGDGIKAEAESVSVHHILIDGLTLRNFNRSQQVVGIGTKCPAWNWVIRNTTITSTGTGIYIGGSDGEFEFTNFLVEHNLIYGTLGYNAQFKHQRFPRNTSIGIPSSGTVIIRHNTFSKETGSSSGADSRPNLLVGHWPLSGYGSTDSYQIYGNLFYQNPVEALFQGEGNIAFHDNLLVNRTGSAVNIQAHYDVPKRIDVFNNTVIATRTPPTSNANGIRISGAASGYTQRVTGNAVFADIPLTGGQQSNNVPSTNVQASNYAQASTYLNNPGAALGAGLNLYPKSGQLQGTAIDYSPFTALLEYDRDFNGTSRVTTFRGAYSGSGVNPGWTPALAIKPPAGTSGGNVLQNGVPVTGLSGALNSQQIWTLTVPAGASNLVFQTSGGTGDMDMHVRFGSAPTLSTYDCRPFESGNNETCTFASPAAGTWYVMLHGYTAYSGMTLVGSYQTGPSCNAISDVEPNDSTAAPQVISGSCNQISGTFIGETAANDYFRLSLPAGKTVTALLNGLTADYDVFLYNAAGTEVAKSVNGGTTPDQASWTNTGSSAVNVYIRINRYVTTKATYQLKISY
ncbi:MAG TPA: PPC domain-containing protein [Thermoanaerobaculia bacterium]|nr:PPC domain-containing protein [Thermoanaerobaculia bacterium]